MRSLRVLFPEAIQIFSSSSAELVVLSRSTLLSLNRRNSRFNVFADPDEMLFGQKRAEK